MSEPTRAVERSTALAWLRQHPAASENARRRADMADSALPDAVLADPARLIDLYREAIVEAVQTDAPAGVAEELLLGLRLVSIGARRFDRYGYVATQLSGLRGLRDQAEIGAALEASAANAPDAASRASLERLIASARAVPVSDTSSVPQTLPAFTDPGVDTSVPAGFDPGPGTGTSAPPPGTGQPDGTTGRPTTGSEGSTGRVTSPGSTDTGTNTGTTTGTDTGTDTGAGTPDLGAQIGSQLGSEIGSSLGVTGGAEVGAQLGSQLGQQLGISGGGVGGDGSGASAFGVIGAAIGAALGGPVGASIGAAIGRAFGAVFLDGGSADDAFADLTTKAACILCGPACIPCVLAAESMTDAIVQPH